MALFKGLQQSKERKKAKAFYEQISRMTGDPREIRKLRALMNARLTGFIDMTFIEGAKDLERHQESGLGGHDPGGFSRAYKAVKTVGGLVVVYLPQKFTNFYYDLGTKYQAAHLTKIRAVTLADETAKEITQLLRLDNPILPLSFLRIEIANEEAAEDGNKNKEEPDLQKDE
ncbi:MAG: hypothetical protein CMQ40_05275 [Gammaproteobacteria bacterium]|nr:hypothetical protein [Gammaproteobacteria bacterium]